MDNGKNTGVKDKETITACYPRPNRRGLLGGGVKYKPVNIQNFEKFSPLQTAI